MLLLAFTAGLCTGLFVLTVVSIFAVGKAIDKFEAGAKSEPTVGPEDRRAGPAAQAANDPQFANLTAEDHVGGTRMAAVEPQGTPPPLPPQPPEGVEIPAFLRRRKCSFCSRLRAFASKVLI